MRNLFHGFPRTPEGRIAARQWLTFGGSHEEALRVFYEREAKEAQIDMVQRPRGKPNKHGVRGLSYSEKTGLWTGEVYIRGVREVFRSHDQFAVEVWLAERQAAQKISKIELEAAVV